MRGASTRNYIPLQKQNRNLNNIIGSLNKPSMQNIMTWTHQTKRMLLWRSGRLDINIINELQKQTMTQTCLDIPERAFYVQ